MRITIFAILFLIMISMPIRGEDEKKEYDYFFLNKGGIFVHVEDEPTSAFSYLEIPSIEPYGYQIDQADMTPSGIIIAVMKGDSEHSSRVDLVRIDPGLKLTPLFALMKREKLDEEIKIDRSFGDVNIDRSTNEVVFSINERLSKVGAIGDAEYSSKIYRIPINGGALEKIGEFNSLCDNLTAGGGIVAIVKSSEAVESYNNLLGTLSPGESSWSITGVQKLDIKSIDLSEDGKSMILLGKAQHGDNQLKLIKARMLEPKGLEIELLEEFDNSEELSEYRFTLSQESLIFRKNVTTEWGKTWLNFLYREGNPPSPLVRFDYAAKFYPLKSKKIDADKIEILRVSPSGDVKQVTTSGSLAQCGSKSSSEFKFADIDRDRNVVVIFDHELNKLGEYPFDSQNKLHGIYWEDNILYSVSQLELGERLLSFESITYGKLVEQSLDGEIENHDLRLAWNIGGKMRGIEIPDGWMFLGGSDKEIYMVFISTIGGVFPTSKDVTPFYILDRESWMIEHPTYLPKAKKTWQYIIHAFKDKSGNLFMLDSLNSLIIKYSSDGKKKSEIGWLPDSLPQLAHPSDFAFYEENLYVLDPVNKRVVVFTIDGKPSQLIILDDKNKNTGGTKFGHVGENGFSLVNLEENELVKYEYQKITEGQE